MRCDVTVRHVADEGGGRFLIQFDGGPAGAARLRSLLRAHGRHEVSVPHPPDDASEGVLQIFVCGRTGAKLSAESIEAFLADAGVGRRRRDDGAIPAKAP